MGIKRVKPTTPGRRQARFDDFGDLTATKPVKSLTRSKRRTNGRNNQGKITIRHRGGGAKRNVRMVDFHQNKMGVPARIKTIEYDPNRGARIALAAYADGERRYILAPDGVTVGTEVVTSEGKGEIKPGNRMPVRFIPSGVEVCNVEMQPGRGGQIARGAGNVVFVMAADEKHTQIKMPSGEIRQIPSECLATIGKMSNPDKRLLKQGKAGRMRHRGIRPTVRGKVMNPVDHPHGGGEGAQPIGLPGPKTPWGKWALGVKTRKPKPSDKLIIQRRKNKKRK